jgi:hypothetical protein
MSARERAMRHPGHEAPRQVNPGHVQPPNVVPHLFVVR